MSRQVLSVQALGTDRSGLVAEVASIVTALRGNIVHVDHRNVRGLFSMFMLIEDPDAGGEDRLRSMGNVLKNRLAKLDLDATMTVVETQPQVAPGDVQAITIMGADKIGVMHAITRTIADHDVPILRVSQVASGELMAFEILVDSTAGGMDELRDDLKSTCEAIGVDVVVQPHGVSRTRRRLIVFDMDSTLIEGEIIDELAKAAGVEDEVSALTERAMQGEMDFKDALKKRVGMLEGLPVETLEQIASSMRLTPGAADMVRALKEMGFKVGVISGGFTFFTDRLQAELGLDHAFANELVIEDGKLTGKVSGEIIDSDRKGEILKRLAEEEGLPAEAVVAVGDGANDQIMLRNAGLGIAFNAKEVLRRAADGTLTPRNIQGLLYCLGATPEDIERYRRTNGKSEDE